MEFIVKNYDDLEEEQKDLESHLAAINACNPVSSDITEGTPQYEELQSTVKELSDLKEQATSKQTQVADSIAKKNSVEKQKEEAEQAYLAESQKLKEEGKHQEALSKLGKITNNKLLSVVGKEQDDIK